MSWRAAPHEIRRHPFSRRRYLTTPAGTATFALTVPEGLRSGKLCRPCRDRGGRGLHPLLRAPADGKPTAKILYSRPDRDLPRLCQPRLQLRCAIQRDAGQPPGHPRPLGAAVSTCIRSSANSLYDCIATAAASAIPRGLRPVLNMRRWPPAAPRASARWCGRASASRSSSRARDVELVALASEASR